MPKGQGRKEGSQNVGIGTVLYNADKLREVAAAAVVGTVEFKGTDKDGEFFKLVGQEKTVRRSEIAKYAAGNAAALRVVFPSAPAVAKKGKK